MRLAFSNLAWPAELDPAILPGLHARGFESLEVAPTRLWSDPLAQPADEVARVRAQIESSGLRITALQSLLFQRPELQLFGNDEAREGLYEHLVGMARLAAALGATRLVFGSPGNRRRGDLPVAQADEIAVELFARLGAVAADLGVCFCIEANPEAYKCDYLTDAVASTAFVRSVDSPGVRLHLDTACMLLAGDDAPERVRAGADVLAHVHASAPQLGVVGGDGPVDHGPVSDALRSVGYTGHVSVEMLPPGGDDLTGAVWRTADFVRKTYA
ncbi:Sugar phosphate isomerase/epimerase [Blastococcus sp. DSM 46786]|uniref:sugar phosphate isomerase/epimerase family protein n=1 Tax=Blastococcus sp. DSM 46786 TaxID=1798227 RepID=UPI0008D7705D|nr:sugar phosphate isomerase/epimerase [Blastococcus sp. DSM 46786]SEK25126.1 Sugar phosphate isomerase/epimerase [Blastococcus sp. DSM 46786]